MVRRLVGFFEYGNALSDFDQLVSLADKDDLDAINEIIADHEEFDVYLRLPEAFAPKSDTAMVTLLEGQNAPGNGREYRQSGLAWVMALARVEFGAMIAGFTDAPYPYANVRPQSYDYGSVMQLLAEGAADHYIALASNSHFTGKGKLDRKNDTIYTALKLSRRARIARAMMQPLLAPGESGYNREQAYQLSEAKDKLEEGSKLVNARIRSYLAARVSKSTSTGESSFVHACGMQLRAESKELAAGTARVYDFAR